MAIHAVIMTICHEPFEQICRAISSIQRHEPGFPIVLITDGTDRPDVGMASGPMGFEFIRGEHLKLLAMGAAWWHRFLLIGLEHQTSHILKFDPDSLFWRRFKGDPPGDHYGTVQAEYCVQGGCEGFSRQFAEKIINSGMTTDIGMCNPHLWASAKSAEQFKRSNYMSTDWTMSYMASRLGVRAAQWDEIRSEWQSTPPNPNGRYAVTHPHKAGALRVGGRFRSHVRRALS